MRGIVGSWGKGRHDGGGDGGGGGGSSLVVVSVVTGR